MGNLQWYKRDPVKFLEGTSELTLEETGAYAKVLDIIYAREGDLVDDDVIVARMLHCDPRIWRRLRATLIRRGKLFVIDGKLHNKKADTVLAEASERMSATVLRPDFGRTSGKSPQTDIPNDLENQSLSDARVRHRSREEPPVAPLGKGGTQSFQTLGGAAGSNLYNLGETYHGKRRRQPRNKLQELWQGYLAIRDAAESRANGYDDCGSVPGDEAEPGICDAPRRASGNL